MEVLRKCPICKKQHLMFLKNDYESALDEFEYGVLIQETRLIELPPQEREFLISGMCMKCQRELYGHREVN